MSILAIALGALSACSSVKYGDPSETETVNIDFGSTDLQNFSATMVKSLADSPQLAYLDGPGKREDKRIWLYMGGIDNRTQEHIDTQAIMERIQAELFKTGRFRFPAADQAQKQIGDQVHFQNEGRFDPQTAKQFGKQIGADMILYGSLVSIEKSKGRSIESGLSKLEDVFYQFTLKAVNIETGEDVWVDLKDIRKKQRTGIFGS
jgi:uncharacterized protein (TIGR02722 family)